MVDPVEQRNHEGVSTRSGGASDSAASSCVAFVAAQQVDLAVEHRGRRHLSLEVAEDRALHGEPTRIAGQRLRPQEQQDVGAGSSQRRREQAPIPPAPQKRMSHHAASYSQAKSSAWSCPASPPSSSSRLRRSRCSSIPGPAVLYVVTQSAEQGRSAGLASVAGIHIGTLIHVAAAAAGLSALIVTSAVAFSIVKYAGAAYLIFLGVRKLLERQPIAETGARCAPLRHVFVRGTVVNVLNPKTALFFLAFLPQFVDADRGAVWSQVVVLGLVFVALGLLSDSAYAIAGDAVGSLLRRRAKAMRRVSGSIYIGLGTVAAFARR